MPRDLPKALFWLSCAALAFGYGVAVGEFRLFPYGLLQDGWNSAKDLRANLETALGVRPAYFLAPARHTGAGVTRYVRDRTAPGLTLVSGFFDGGNELRLIRLDGSIVRRWPARFTDIFPNQTHIAPAQTVPKGNWNVEVHGSLALPDGSVVFNFEYAGIVKLDRCGRVQWTVPRMTHHSVEPSEDGGFWVSSRRYVQGTSPFPEFTPPYHEETLMKVSATGTVLDEISVLGVLFKNDLQGSLFATSPLGQLPADFPHLNDVKELSSTRASRFPQFAAGDVLVSLRALNMLMVVDPRTQKVKWHQVGRWISQHDPDFEANGRISLFNNNRDGTPTGSLLGGSNILEVDPVTGATRVMYGGISSQRMYSENMGKHQSLESPAGNILITESTAGRVLEVDSTGETVWQFINRFDDDEVALVFEATRYPEGYFTVTDWTCK